MQEIPVPLEIRNPRELKHVLAAHPVQETARKSSAATTGRISQAAPQLLLKTNRLKLRDLRERVILRLSVPKEPRADRQNVHSLLHPHRVLRIIHRAAAVREEEGINLILAKTHFKKQHEIQKYNFTCCPAGGGQYQLRPVRFRCFTFFSI